MDQLDIIWAAIRSNPILSYNLLVYFNSQTYFGNACAVGNLPLIRILIKNNNRVISADIMITAIYAGNVVLVNHNTNISAMLRSISASDNILSYAATSKNLRMLKFALNHFVPDEKILVPPTTKFH